MPGRSTRPSNADPAPAAIDRVLAAVDRVVGGAALWGGGAMLLGLMGLTVLDVVLRYCFNAPLYGARDVAKLMLLVMVALAVAHSARTGGQVIIAFFSRRMGPRLAAASEAGARLAGIVMLAVLASQLWISGRRAGMFGETSLALEIPYGPFYWVLALGMLLYAVALMIELLFILAGRCGDLRRPPEDMPP